MEKIYLNQNVLEATKERISFVFDNFEKIYISFSGGKDSTVMTHLVMDEAIKRGVKVGLFFVDWECQFTLTVDHIRNIFNKYKNHIIPYWVQLPIRTWNGCSQHEPEWTAWDENKKELWVRDKENNSIFDKSYFPFYYENIMFEEFCPLFGEWYSEGQSCANFIGIRTQESLNRFRTCAITEKPTFKGKQWSTKVTKNSWSFYPIYDWQTQDDWIYFAKSGNEYNKLYDRMYQSGMTIHQMRIDEPFGDTQRRALWLYQIIEPRLWAKMVSRVAGCNTGALYCKEKGNILGNQKIVLPQGHTYKTFAKLLLNTMPPKTSLHYKNKISVYLKWYRERGYPEDIPDHHEGDLNHPNIPSWRKICKTLLRNDYWCKGLGFSPTKTTAYAKYLKLMERRKKEWNLNF